MDWLWRVERAKKAGERKQAEMYRKRIEALNLRIENATDPSTDLAEFYELIRQVEVQHSKMWMYEQAALRRTATRLGISIPEGSLRQNGVQFVATLTDEGESLLRREIKRTRRADRKQFVESFSPIVGWCISIGSLLVAWAALHKR